MTEPNKPPPVAISRALQQIEDMLTSSEEAISVCSCGPDSVLWQKWQFLTNSLLVRKRWEHLPEASLISRERRNHMRDDFDQKTKDIVREAQVP